LLQNNPNPSNGYTEIFYECNDAGTASITVTDQQGRVRKVFNNVAKGLNKVVVNRGELEPGIYIYTIALNGKIAASKQMVIVR
jgi:Secretion system C-terminal sorting domain